MDQFKAAREGNLDWFKTNTYSPNLINDSGYTCLCYASSCGHEDIVAELLQSGANPNVQTIFPKTTAIMLACYKGYSTITLMLVQAGADPLIKDVLGLNAYDHTHRNKTSYIVDVLNKWYRIPNTLRSITQNIVRDLEIPIHNNILLRRNSIKKEKTIF